MSQIESCFAVSPSASTATSKQNTLSFALDNTMGTQCRGYRAKIASENVASGQESFSDAMYYRERGSSGHRENLPGAMWLVSSAPA
jgi:hypothetical protein